MARKVLQILLLLAIVGLVTGVSFADQITLSNSTSGQVQFSGTNPNTTATFGTLKGTGLFGGTLGKYQIVQSGSGSPILTNTFFDVYSVNMGSAVLTFSMVLSDAQHSSITGILDLETLIGGSTKAPEFIGTFSTTSESGVFTDGQYLIGGKNPMDLTVNLHASKSTVNDVYNGTAQSAKGPISSGEIPGVPEPATLGLLGSGLLTIAGLLRRRIL